MIEAENDLTIDLLVETHHTLSTERAELVQGPIKYHGKWPFQLLFDFQDFQ